MAAKARRPKVVFRTRPSSNPTYRARTRKDSECTKFDRQAVAAVTSRNHEASPPITAMVPVTKAETNWLPAK